jgi:hypothetical protein
MFYSFGKKTVKAVNQHNNLLLYGQRQAPKIYRLLWRLTAFSARGRCNKTFWYKFPHAISMLNNFINVTIIFLNCVKKLSKKSW